MKRTYYDMEFEPDSIEFDGDHAGTPMSVSTVVATHDGTKYATVLLDREQVQNLVHFLNDWLVQQPVVEPPRKRKWSA